MRPMTLVVALVATAALAGPAARQAATAPPRHPNVVYIYADDLGYAELGSYGQRKIRTPHLDRFAREGLRFTQHYSSAPVCAPARGALMTGLHTGHAYIRGNYELGGFRDEEEGGQMPMHSGARTVAHVMREAGYATAAVGKWGLGMFDNTGNPNAQGFDLFYGLLDQKQAHNYYPTHLWENGRRVPLRNAWFSAHQALPAPPADPRDYDRFRGVDYAPDLMTARAMSFIEQQRDRPFFLYLAYPLPHVALQAPEAAVKAYEGQFDERPYLGSPSYLPTPAPRATYAAMISTLDAYVGRVLDTLERLGLDRQTLVMFSSDNGTTFTGGVDRVFFDSLGGLRGAKMDVYEGGIRVPFVARWPGRIAPGGVTDHVSAQYDVLATIGDLVGTPVGTTDGISFLPTLLGNTRAQPTHEFLYFEYPENGGQLAVRLGRWKGVKVGMKADPTTAWQLFDLSSDPAESTDVAAGHPDVLSRLDAVVAREHRRAHIVDWEFIDSRVPLKR